jgi:hypothetical protein
MLWDDPGLGIILLYVRSKGSSLLRTLMIAGKESCFFTTRQCSATIAEILIISILRLSCWRLCWQNVVSCVWWNAKTNSIVDNLSSNKLSTRTLHHKNVACNCKRLAIYIITSCEILQSSRCSLCVFLKAALVQQYLVFWKYNCWTFSCATICAPINGLMRSFKDDATGHGDHCPRQWSSSQLVGWMEGISDRAPSCAATVILTLFPYNQNAHGQKM